MGLGAAYSRDHLNSRLQAAPTALLQKHFMVTLGYINKRIDENKSKPDY
ncbi:hypothetical protein D1AOALGA4SA_9258 [Olavius algarvensis Delta 1 endosymbiont]|nr:hypothetical protein D1AOALGA4SA_9258 [Olavius algarvensis Delta 1 endosymbiont]